MKPCLVNWCKKKALQYSVFTCADEETTSIVVETMRSVATAYMHKLHWKVGGSLNKILNTKGYDFPTWPGFYVKDK
jgi:hypothetical protein